MKKVLLTTSIACTLILFLVIGCKKTGDTTAVTDSSLQSTASQNATDQSTLQNDDDAIANAVTQAVETFPKFVISGAESNLHIGTFGDSTLPPPHPMDSLHGMPPPMDSMSCPGILIDRNPIIKGLHKLFVHFRRFKDPGGLQINGNVSVTLLNGRRWDTIGAVLQEKDTLTITGRDGKTRTYINERSVTNLTGGSLFSILPAVFSYSVHTKGSVTYNDGTVRSYWISRKNSFNKLLKSFSIAGDTSVNNQVSTMGGNSRFGKSFILNAPEAIVADSLCGYGRPKAGIRTYISGSDTIKVTYGVDGTGTRVTSGCADFYKVNWTKLNGQTGTLVVSY